MERQEMRLKREMGSRGDALMERTSRFYPVDQCFCGPRTISIRITWGSV